MHILRKGVLANSSEDLVIMLSHYQRDPNQRDPNKYQRWNYRGIDSAPCCGQQYVTYSHKIFFTPKEKGSQKYAQKAYFKQSKLRDLHIAEDTTFTRTTKFETELTISTRLQSVEEDSFNRQNK